MANSGVTVGKAQKRDRNVLDNQVNEVTPNHAVREPNQSKDDTKMAEGGEFAEKRPALHSRRRKSCTVDITYPSKHEEKR